jgi:pilus assembly protein CpaB
MPVKGPTYLVLALLAGVIGVFAIHQAVSTKGTSGSETTSPVVVADADISSGTALKPNLVRIVNWPNNIIPPQVATKVAQVENRVVTVPLVKGEAILMAKLAPEGSAAGLGGIIREDMHAFAVKVDDVSGVAGFVHPGARVDIFMVLPSIQNTGEHLSKLILQDIKVLTAGQIWEQTGTSKPTLVNTVTLEVTPQQAEILNLASTQGRIRLAMRSSANKKLTPTTGISTSFFFGGQKQPESKPEATPESKPEKSVEVIKGTNKTSSKL